MAVVLVPDVVLLVENDYLSAQDLGMLLLPCELNLYCYKTLSRIVSSASPLLRGLSVTLLACIAIYWSTGLTLALILRAPEITCVNPGFEAGNLSCWNQGGSTRLVRAVQTESVFDGNYAAVVGDPFSTTEECAGHLPLGNAWISYIVTVPDYGTPFLSFDYRLLSYDEIVEGYEERFDKFDVYIDDLTDSLPRFRILRAGSDDGVPAAGPPRPCDYAVDDTDWLSESWDLSAVRDFDRPGQTYDLRGKAIEVVFEVVSQELVGSEGWYNTWVYIDNLQLRPEIAVQKSASPAGPVHEGDTVTYSLAYANTSLITQTLTLTDLAPFNVNVIPHSIVPAPTVQQSSHLVWDIGDVPPGGTGQVSFQVQVPLLPVLPEQPLEAMSSMENAPAYIVPAAVTCDTTRFWASGVTQQPTPPGPYTFYVWVPPQATPSAMWLLIRDADHTAPIVSGRPASLSQTSANDFGASLWSVELSPDMLASGQLSVTTPDARQLNALFLFNKDSPPFVASTLTDFYKSTRTFTFTFDIPSVEEGAVDVILPLMDITYWSSNPLPDTRLTTVTMTFNDQEVTVPANAPNLGNGLLMVQAPFAIGPLSEDVTSLQVLTVTIDTEDSLYTLAPRVCRPVYIENTAWLCSEQAGCISATARNLPERFKSPFEIYLPVILRDFR